MVETSTSEISSPELPKVVLRAEASELLDNYKAVFMKSPRVQKAIVTSFFGGHEQTPHEAENDIRVTEFRLSEEHELTIKYSPRRSLSVELRGDDDTTKVVFKPEEPFIEWSYKNDDGRRKSREYKNTRDAVGNSNLFLGFLRRQLSP